MVDSDYDEEDPNHEGSLNANEVHDLSEGENNETSSASEEEDENSGGYARVQVELQEYTKKCQNSDLSENTDKLDRDQADPDGRK